MAINDNPEVTEYRPSLMARIIDHELWLFAMGILLGLCIGISATA